MTPAKRRLDEELVARGHYASRSRAQDAVKRQTVRVNGIVSVKPGAKVSTEDQIEIADPASRYVSRAALKLVAALDAFQFNPNGLNALDVGASTGGFTQVLLERGAKHVVALDVGHDQLASSLISDPRVTNMEGTNARDIVEEDIPFPIQVIVSDVSFISLKLALPPALKLAESSSFAAFLVKPQFEVGKDGIGKGGLVKSEAIALAAANRVRDWLNNFPGWRVVNMIPSPITGSDGNKEFLLGALKD